MTSGVFLVTELNSSNTLQALTDRILKLYDPIALPRWTLEHRLFRSIPHSADENANPRFLHLLTASYTSQDQTYIYINSPEKFKREGGREGEREGEHEEEEGSKKPSSDSSTTCDENQSIIAIPRSQSESHHRLLETSFGALWMPRQTLTVNNGLAFDLGEFIVRLAEVRQADVQHTLKGIAVAIEIVLSPSLNVLSDDGEETAGGIEDKKQQSGKAGTSGAGGAGGGEGFAVQGEEVKGVIRELWKSFGPDNAKETWVPAMKDGMGMTMSKNTRIARLWCESLQGR